LPEQSCPRAAVPIYNTEGGFIGALGASKAANPTQFDFNNMIKELEISAAFLNNSSNFTAPHSN